MYPASVILVVQGESGETDNIAAMLSENYRVIGSEQPEDAMTHASDGVDLVISELESSNLHGLDLLRTWKARQPRTPFLLITDGEDVSSVVEAMKLGAADCIVKPIDAGELRATVARLVRTASSNADEEIDAEGEVGIEPKSSIDIPPGSSLEDVERAAVEQALAQHEGNRTHAAKTLGISVRTLQRKLKAWGILVPANHDPALADSFLLSAHNGAIAAEHEHSLNAN